MPPLTTRAPLQLGSWALLAVQLVALLLFQLNALEPPRTIAGKLALRLGPGAAPTVTVVSTNSDAPPVPSQVSLYVEVTVGVTSWVPPLMTRAPLQLGSSALLAVQLVAFPLPQVSVLDPPSAIVEKLALRAGAGGALTATRR